jgi:hypothetical protein
MKRFHNLSEAFSNWEIAAFLTIKHILVGKILRFSRSELMNFSNLENAQKLLIFFGHKENPQKLESTMQRTIQNLRIKGYISFIDRGEYKLTSKGENALNSLSSDSLEIWGAIRKCSVNKILEFKKEFEKNQP